MKNHKWSEENKCSICGLYREKCYHYPNILDSDERKRVYRYSWNKKDWTLVRPGCERTRLIVNSNKKNNTSYSDLLKDPRWQRKRLEIMQRDNFECRACKSNDKTLHVHHMIYNKGLMPWEYDNHDLMTLCENCHEAMTYVYNGGYGWDTIWSITDLHTDWECEGINIDKHVI